MRMTLGLPPPPFRRSARNHRFVLIWVSGFGYRVSGLEFWVSGFGFRVSGLEFRVSGFGFRISGFGFPVSGLGFQG